jgi:hypothetical protein
MGDTVALKGHIYPRGHAKHSSIEPAPVEFRYVPLLGQDVGLIIASLQKKPTGHGLIWKSPIARKINKMVYMDVLILHDGHVVVMQRIW